MRKKETAGVKYTHIPYLVAFKLHTFFETKLKVIYYIDAVAIVDFADNKLNCSYETCFNTIW